MKEKIIIGLTSLGACATLVSAQSTTSSASFEREIVEGPAETRGYLQGGSDSINGTNSPQLSFGTSVALSKIPQPGNIYVMAVAGYKNNQEFLQIYERTPSTDWGATPVAEFEVCGGFGCSLRPTVAITDDGSWIVAGAELDRFRRLATGWVSEEFGEDYDSLFDASNSIPIVTLFPDRTTPVDVDLAVVGGPTKYVLVAVGDPEGDQVHLRQWEFAPTSAAGANTLISPPVTSGSPGLIGGQPGSAFGYSVAIDAIGIDDPEPYIAIGAPFEDQVIGGTPFLNVGQVYSCALSGGSISPRTPVATVTNGVLPLLEEDSNFGSAIDIVNTASGTSLVAVGEWNRNITNASGRVHVLTNAAIVTGGWSSEATLTDDQLDPSGYNADGPFGYGVAISGNEGGAIVGVDPTIADDQKIIVSRPRNIDFDNVGPVGFQVDVQGDGSINPGEPDLLDPSPPATLADAFVYSRESATTDWLLRRRLSASDVGSSSGSVGYSVDANAVEVVLGDPIGSAYRTGDSVVYSFDPIAESADAKAILDDPSLDLNASGVLDSNPLDRPRFDFAAGCDQEIVILVDTSTSFGKNDANDRFTAAFDLVVNLQNSLPSSAQITLLGISENFKDTSGRMSDGYAVLYSNRAHPSPRAASGCIVCDMCSNYVATHVDREEPFNGSIAADGSEGARESWGAAASAIARSFPWTSQDRSIVILTDEWACLGVLDTRACDAVDPSPARDLQAAIDAGEVLRQFSIRGFVVAADSCLGIDIPLDVQAEEFFDASFGPLVQVNQTSGVFRVATEQDIPAQGNFADDGQSPTLADVLVDRPAPTCCPGDANQDGAVDLADLNLVLGGFGGPAFDVNTATNPLGGYLFGDVNGDGLVNLADLNLVLGNFGSDCTTGTSQSFSMSTTDTEELPVTVWLMLKDHPNAGAWIDQLSHFDPTGQKQDAEDLKEWVDDWEGGSPE